MRYNQPELNHDHNKKRYNKKAIYFTRTIDWRMTTVLKKRIADTVQLKKGDYILDVGCGIGDLLKSLSDLKPLYCFGIDLSENMIERAQKTYSSIRFTIGSVEKLPYENNYFNVVTLVGVFHHIQNPIESLKEIKRVLKDDGEIIIGDFTLPIGIRDGCNMFLPYMHTGDVKVYSRSEMIRLFEQVGFKHIKWEQRGIQFIISARNN